MGFLRFAKKSCSSRGSLIDRSRMDGDAGSGDNSSICLEHHPADWPRGGRYELAFRSAKEFLESCGYEVEVDGEA